MIFKGSRVVLPKEMNKNFIPALWVTDFWQFHQFIILRNVCSVDIMENKIEITLFLIVLLYFFFFFTINTQIAHAYQ